MMKRFISILLSLVLCTAMVSAFAEVKDVALTGTVNQYGWEVPVETLKFTYYSVGDDAANQAEEDDRLARTVDPVLKDEFNVEIQKNVYAQDATERLNLMLAANDYPDLIWGMPEEMANTFISQGRAVELTPYLDEYGQDIYASYGEYINLLKEDDGSLYKLSSCIGNTTDLMGADFSMRYDWYLDTGLPIPQSMEDYYNVMKAILEKHPTNENGEKVYAFTAFTDKGKEFFRTPLLYLGFYSAPTGIYKMDEDGTIHYWVDTDEGRQVAHYINKFWQEGMIDPDFQSKDYDQSKAFMSNSRVAGNIGTWWHSFVGGHQIWETTDENYDVNKHMRSVTWEEGTDKPHLITNNYIRSDRVIITDKCKDVEGIIRFMNWQQSPAGLAFCTMGPAGDDDTRAWHYNADGDIEMNEKYWWGDPDNSSFLWDDFENKVCGGWNYDIAVPGYTPVNRMDNPAEGYAAPIEKICAWDPVPDYSALDPARISVNNNVFVLDAQTSKYYLADLTAWTISLPSDDPVMLVKQDVDDEMLTDWCKCIMAESDEECDQLYDEMVANLHDLGLEDLVKAQQEAVSINMSKLDGSYFAK